MSVPDAVPGRSEPEALPGGRHATGWRLTWLPLVLWSGLVLAAWLVGTWINATAERDMLVQAPPLTGHFDLRVRWWIMPAIVLALLAVRFGPEIAKRTPWRLLLLVAAVSAAVWALFLAMGDGPNHLTYPVRSHNDYYADVWRVASPVSFLSTFIGRLPEMTPHTRAHPPGFLLMLWGMDAVGLGGASRVAALEIIGGAFAVPAVLVTLREVAGERNARVAAPFIVFAPVALWVATTADAFFMGATAWAIALLVLSTSAQGGRRRLMAFAGGVVFGGALFLSYGMVLAILIPLAVIWHRRAWDVMASAALGAVIPFAIFAAAGFWWFDGVWATRQEYLRGISQVRPYAFFVWANLAAFAVTIGPAIAPALARLRDRRVWLLVGAALLAVIVADLSGMSKAEVERIWLPFAIWVLPASVAFARSARLRTWLGSQIAFALVVQLVFRGPG